MAIFTVLGTPHPWKAPMVTRTNAYDIQGNIKDAVTMQLKCQITNVLQKAWHFPLSVPIRIDFYFEMPLPSGYSKKKLIEFDEDWKKGTKWWCVGKSDRSNCLKLMEDCLQRAGIIKNDNLIVCGETQKYYSREPKTIIVIQKMDDV